MRGDTRPCRGMNCHAVELEEDMIPARKVLGGRARGWFCVDCAGFWLGRRLERVWSES